MSYEFSPPLTLGSNPDLPTGLSENSNTKCLQINVFTCYEESVGIGEYYYQ